MTLVIGKILLVMIFVSLVVITVVKVFSNAKPKPNVEPQPTPKILKLIDHYEPPKIATASSYTLIFVGDSMTEALGENFDSLRLDLTKYYQKKVFGIFNYGFGSSNILSIKDRLDNDTDYMGKNFPAILGRYFDIILIESFGNNPLSEFPIDQGLQKQTAALDQMVAQLNDTHPNSLIIFIATVAPSSLYGKGVVALSPEERIKWANERRAYIENHISYAEKHNIPIINVYEKTLDRNGMAINKYINTSSYIHPSAAGVNFISQLVADYLYQNHILLN